MKQQSGLTLIEVLIASMILFMAIGLISSVLQQNYLVQSQAERYLKVAGDYNSVVAQVRFSLEAGQTSGTIESGNKQYQWQAKLIEEKPEIVTYSDETNSVIYSNSTLRLFNVEISDESSFFVEFKQVIWSNSQA